jgi:hypothetical protein
MVSLRGEIEGDILGDRDVVFDDEDMLHGSDYSEYIRVYKWEVKRRLKKSHSRVGFLSYKLSI